MAIRAGISLVLSTLKHLELVQVPTFPGFIYITKALVTSSLTIRVFGPLGFRVWSLRFRVFGPLGFASFRARAWACRRKGDG